MAGKNESRDRDEPVAQVADLLGAVLKAATTGIHDEDCKKLLTAAVKKLQNGLDKDRREIVRYAEAGGDPTQAVRGTFPASADPQRLARLERSGWIKPFPMGKKTYYRFQIGDALVPEVGSKVRDAAARKPPRKG